MERRQREAAAPEAAAKSPEAAAKAESVSSPIVPGGEYASYMREGYPNNYARIHDLPPPIRLEDKLSTLPAPEAQAPPARQEQPIGPPVRSNLGNNFHASIERDRLEAAKNAAESRRLQTLQVRTPEYLIDSPNPRNPGTGPMSVTSYDETPNVSEPPRKRKDDKPTPYK